MRHSRRLVSLALFLAGFSMVAAQEAEPGQAVVRLTFKIVNGSTPGQDAARTYQMVGSPGDQWLNITQGFRVPIPTTTFKSPDKKGAARVPVTTFSYQNVGFSASVLLSVHPDGRIHIYGKVEDSSVADKESYPGQPIIATVNQGLNVTLKDGESTRIGWVENAEFGSMFLEIAAEILN